MNVGVNYLHEHMPDDARINYAVLDTGGRSTNVVQAVPSRSTSCVTQGGRSVRAAVRLRGAAPDAACPGS
jgi:hypothetical protein